ncbi:MAG: 2-succinyl-6-hydroxy-2,4-cyclohexadiene-1-carboxylate synthase [Anaerolineae bacterium]
MFISINGIQYHYQVQGDGYPLLLLHGFTGSTENWWPLIPDLAESFQTITVDLPGHGKTESPTDYLRYAMESVSKDIIQLMESLDHERFNLLGYSMGGRTALYLAVHYPDRINKLILESASPGLKTAAEREGRREFDNKLANRIQEEGIDKFVAFWESISLWESQESLPDNVKTNLRKIRLANNADGLVKSLRGAGTGEQPSVWPHLPKIENPVLLLTGELDHKFCDIAAEMLSKLPNGQHQVVLKAGHTVHLENPNRWLEVIQNFLS